ncbi:MAG: hypothetical protein MPJ22_03295 [Pirellulales bacterium]|nr:hypothetical protein [Pirellulales bacterium]
MSTSRLTDASRGHQEPESDRSAADLSPLQGTVDSFRDRSPSPAHHPHSQASDDGDLTTDGNSTDYASRRKKRRSRGSRSSQAGRRDQSISNSNKSTSSNGGKKKKDGFSSKIQIPAFGGKKGHSDDVTGAFRQWARCITYYRDYYEDSYLMPLVVSSLTGDASDVFDWIRSLDPGNTEDLTALLQMLREHYCGSLTFREQRNTIENLCQKPQEAAIDFLIRVGTSVSNLGKDWKDELTEDELRSLQYEVSLNGVKEEIRHVLDSKIARRGWLTPQQMYEAVKKYETYVAHNKRLDGKGTSSSTNQQKATGRTSGYQPRFHKTTAFAATIEEAENDAHHSQEPSPLEEVSSYGVESPQEEDDGLYIPSYLEEVIPDNPVLQVNIARTMRPRRGRPEGVISVTNKVTSKKTMISLRKKMEKGPSS